MKTYEKHAMRYPIAELLTTTLGFTSAVFKKKQPWKMMKDSFNPMLKFPEPTPVSSCQKKTEKKQQNNMILSIYFRHVFGQFSRCFLVDKNSRMPWISVAIFPSPQLTCFWGNCPAPLLHPGINLNGNDGLRMAPTIGPTQSG